MAAVASASTTQSRLSDEQELKEFCDIVWGPNIRLDVFQRWSQGLLSLIYSQALNVHVKWCKQRCKPKFAIVYPQNIDFNSMQWHINASFFYYFVVNYSPKTFFLHIFAGFEFSEYEPSALVQRQGGPCAVIAPVQAFLLKTLLSEANSSTLSDVSSVCTKNITSMKIYGNDIDALIGRWIVSLKWIQCWHSLFAQFVLTENTVRLLVFNVYTFIFVSLLFLAHCDKVIKFTC